MKSEIESMPMKSSNKNSQDVPSGYKRTEIGVIPKDWEVKPLKVLSTSQGIVRGPFGGSLKKEVFKSSGFKVYEQRNAIYKNCTIGSYFIDKSKYQEMQRFSIKPKDFIISCSGTIGKIFQIPENAPEGIINQALLKITLNNEIINEDYFYFYFQWNNFQQRIIESTQGGAMKNLVGMNVFQSTLLGLPSIKEQKAIAKVLSDVDSLIDSLDKLIHKKKAIKKAAMQQLLTGDTRLPGFTEPWETKRLGDFAEIIMGQSPSSVNYNTSGYGMPLIQGNADIINRKTVKRIYTTEVTKRGKHGDIIMSVRAPVGEISFATFDTCLGRGVCAIRYKNNFLYYYLISIEPKWSKWSKGSTFDSINSKEVKELPINIPPSIDEQKAIAKVLSDMDAEIEALEKRKEKTEQMKQGMMQQLLTGKIRLSTLEETL